MEFFVRFFSVALLLSSCTFFRAGSERYVWEEVNNDITSLVEMDRSILEYCHNLDHIPYPDIEHVPKLQGGAFYVPQAKKIVYQKGWELRHEMVHHILTQADLSHTCKDELFARSMDEIDRLEDRLKSEMMRRKKLEQRRW